MGTRVGKYLLTLPRHTDSSDDDDDDDDARMHPHSLRPHSLSFNQSGHQVSLYSTTLFIIKEVVQKERNRANDKDHVICTTCA